MVKRGTMDATIIVAPSSTKNESRERDQEMAQARKGNNWHFGMKAHIGVDTDSGLVHTVITTLANEHPRTGAARGEAKGQGESAGRASELGVEVHLRLPEGSVQRADKEHVADRHVVRPVELVHGAKVI